HPAQPAPPPRALARRAGGAGRAALPGARADRDQGRAHRGAGRPDRQQHRAGVRAAMSAAPSARGVGCEAAAGAVPLRVLQCGYSKSGNYLLHRVLSSLLEAHGQFRSFVAASGVGAAIDALCGATRRMPDARRVDNLKLVDGAWHVQFPDMRCRFLPVDWSLVLAHSTLVWSHDRPDDLVPYEDDFSHRIYI